MLLGSGVISSLLFCMFKICMLACMILSQNKCCRECLESLKMKKFNLIKFLFDKFFKHCWKSFFLIKKKINANTNIACLPVHLKPEPEASIESETQQTFNGEWRRQ